MSERTTASSRRPVAEAIGAIVTIVLAILALAHVAPTFLVAIATIAFGAALLLHGSATVAEYGRLYTRAGEGAASTVIPVHGGGLSAVLLAGAGGIVLGILALLGIGTMELTAIAVIAYGSALILSSNSALRLHLAGLALEKADERTQHLASDLIAGEMLSSSAGLWALTGLAAIVLGILALAGFSSVILVLIALLALGLVSVLDRIDITGMMVSASRGT